METKKVAKSSNIFECIICNYKTDKNSNYKKHLLTRKHSEKQMETKTSSKVAFLYCDCEQRFRTRSGLWKHKKQCKYLSVETNKSIETNKSQLKNTIIELENDEKTIDYKAMLLQVMKENTEIKNLLVAQQKQIIDILPNLGNTTNNIKQKFNINMFLNEKCKDALSIDEFIDKLEISMKNLLTTRDKGLSEGVTNIIIDNMNKLSLYERPMHCTDKKRETLYVKNQEWEKDANKQHIDHLLKEVELKQMKNINQWTKEHPEYETDDHLQTEYIDLVRKCTSSIEACKEKVIKNICGNVYLLEKDPNE